MTAVLPLSEDRNLTSERGPQSYLGARTAILPRSEDRNLTSERGPQSYLGADDRNLTSERGALRRYILVDLSSPMPSIPSTTYFLPFVSFTKP